jgi:hypothetical protein
MTQHKATPDQWADVKRFLPANSSIASCLLELRHRIEVIEDAANHFPGATKMVPAPAGGLVERVCDAIGTADKPASAAILAVADWLDQPPNAYGNLHSRRLRQEVERG